MPVHKKSDGTTVNIPWPPPKESGVKIHTRLVKLKAEAGKQAENEVKDEETGWTLKVEEKEERKQQRLDVILGAPDSWPT